MPKKPYHSKRSVINKITEGKVFIEPDAIAGARRFGWGRSKIFTALKKIPTKDCYKTEPRFNNPAVWVDYYRSYGLLGENVYVHFYIEDDTLVIDSFKEI